jgi:cobalamin biosynthetic protein CobC
MSMKGGGQKRLHGGDVSALNRHAESIVDLSTGINPNPYPWWRYIEEPEIRALSHDLPQSMTANACMGAFYQYAGIKDQIGWYMGPGTQALIEWLPTLFTPRHVMIASPTYSEHELSWQNAGHDVAAVDLEQIDFDQIEPASILVITNPNNPDGRLVDPDILMEWAGRLEHNNSILIVDEAFIDLTPEKSLCAYDLPENIIVFRSFGKFFGLAGLRLGFVRISTDCPHIKPFVNALWPVSGLTMRAATLAVRDDSWITNTLFDLRKASKRMKTILAQSDLSLVGGTNLYQLVSNANAQIWYQRLLDAGIYVRRFEYDPTWLRFGLPGNEAGWQCLEKAVLGT